MAKPIALPADQKMGFATLNPSSVLAQFGLSAMMFQSSCACRLFQYDCDVPGGNIHWSYKALHGLADVAIIVFSTLVVEVVTFEYLLYIPLDFVSRVQGGLLDGALVVRGTNDLIAQLFIARHNNLD